MNGKKARALRRLAKQVNTEENVTQEIKKAKIFKKNKDDNGKVVEVKTIRHLGWLRFYKGLKKHGNG